MPQRDDLMEMGMDALQEAKDIAVDMVREQRASVVNAPAFGRELSREERINHHLAFLNEPGSVSLSWDELETRFKVPEGQIPRRWLEYGKLAWKELQEMERKAERNGNQG